MSRTNAKIRGHVTLENVTFQHPRYAGLLKLRRFRIDVRADEIVGRVTKFDGEHHDNFETKNLRGQMNLVEGDPTFFKCSIADNINYGDKWRISNGRDCRCFSKRFS